MNNERTNEREVRQRKFFLVLPVFAIPFLTLFFFLMGGGTGTPTGSTSTNSGFNSLLPEANKDEVNSKDKLASYEQAKLDSIKRLEAARQDPYYTEFPGGADEFGGISKYGVPGLTGSYANVNEQKIYNRLSEINKSLEQAQVAEEPTSFRSNYNRSSYGPDPEVIALRRDISNLENMMQNLQTSSNADPEMDQINMALQSVLDIQHPERVQERLQKDAREKTGQVFAVAPSRKETPLTLLDNRSAIEHAKSFEQNPSGNNNSFFGLETIDNASPLDQNAIAAVIHEDQPIVNGSTVKLRTTDEVNINGVSIPKDHFIFGTATLRGERLEIDIASVRFANSLFPVSLSVYDLDGLPGVHIPGAITRDVIKQNSEQSLQSLNFGTFNPSLGAQAASAGIELGKNLFSRKVKLIKVDLKAGYKVYLKDNKRKDN